MTPKQTIESLYDAFNRGDIPFIIGLVAPNATWRQTRSVPWGGDYNGPAGAAEFFTRLNAAAESTGFVSHELIEKGNEVFSFATWRANMRGSGKPVSVDLMFRWSVEGGKVTRYESYIDSAVVTAAMN